jgi:hypothetical protein
MSVDPTVDISVPKADEDSEAVHEAEGPEVSRNEYLHEGGWENVDNPLHELEFVQNEMHMQVSFRSRTFRASTMYNV